jgi:hypothetical protein
MHTAIYVLLLVVAILALQVLIWIPIILRFRRRYRAAHARLAAEMEAETVLVPFEKGGYQGATAAGFPRVKNSGRIALTRRRLVFLTLTGKTFDIPLETIIGLREAKTFNGEVVGGRTHLVVQVRSGEVGFFVPNNAAWISDLTAATH